MIRDTPSYGIYFCLYERGKETLEPGSRQHGCRNPLTLFAAGARPAACAARACAGRWASQRARVWRVARALPVCRNVFERAWCQRGRFEMRLPARLQPLAWGAMAQ